MLAKNVFFVFLGLLLIDCNIFAFVHSNDKYNIGRINRYSQRRAEPRAVPRGFKHRKYTPQNGLATNTSKQSSAPSLPVPRTQLITKDFRQKVYGRLFTRKENRATQAGYTNNLDTCSIYNENLEKVWNELSSYMNNEQETPDYMALHNIVLLVSAYLDHHTDPVKVNTTPNIARESEHTAELIEEPKTDKVKNIIAELLLSHIDDKTPDEIITTIEKNIFPHSNTDEMCIKKSQDKLKINVLNEYQKYVDHSNCINIGNDEYLQEGKRKAYEKMSFEEAKEFVRQWTMDRKAKCKLVAKELFLEAMRSIIKEYVNDIQCLTPN